MSKPESQLYVALWMDDSRLATRHQQRGETPGNAAEDRFLIPKPFL